MTHHFKKWHIVIMSFFALFIAIFASLFNLKADPVNEDPVEENQTADFLADNWELGIVFYDSTVNNGNTPLTEINWDASNGGYGVGETRVITMQINYKAWPKTTYSPGEIILYIDNLVYSSYSNNTPKGMYGSQLSYKVTIGANDATHTGYEWDLESSATASSLTFSNVGTIQEGVNFEGSIQIVYEFTPQAEYKGTTDPEIEKYEDECTHAFSSEIDAGIYTTHFYDGDICSTPGWPEPWPTEKGLVFEYVYENEKAKDIKITIDKNSYMETMLYSYNKKDQTSPNGFFLDRVLTEDKTSTFYNTNYLRWTFTTYGQDIGCPGFYIKLQYSVDQRVYSNKLTFNYTRTYSHPWEKLQYKLIKSAKMITSLDYLPDASDYTWVNYSFSISHNQSGYMLYYPYVDATNFYVVDSFPEECVVFDGSTRTILNSETGEYIISGDSLTKIVVGYPKSIYNEEDQTSLITNTAQLYGTFRSETEEEFLAEGSVSLDLKDFKFSYTGSLYSISKAKSSSYLRDQMIAGHLPSISQKATNYAEYTISYSAKYSGKPMDVKVADDLSYIYDRVNNYRELTDDECNISSLTINALKDGYSNTVYYDVDLYVRYANETDFVLYGTYSESKTISFTNGPKVAEFYIVVKDVVTTVSSSVKLTMKYNKADIEPEGKIYNVCYLDVYIDGERVNSASLNNYDSYTTKQVIAPYDLEKYGHYQQRAQVSCDYYTFKMNQMNMGIGAKKTIKNTTQNAKDEYFSTTFSLTAMLTESSQDDYYYPELEDLYTAEEAFTGCTIYDLLPEGLELTSSPEDIIESTINTKATSSDLSYPSEGPLYDKNIERISVADVMAIIKANTTVEIIPNWRNSNRTMIIINVDMAENPIMLQPYRGNTTYLFPTWTYSCKISYDSYLEYGPTWTNYMYIEKTNQANNYHNDCRTWDQGYYEPITSDINNNGSTSEELAYAKKELAITSIVSSNQAVTTLVKTEYNNYTSDIADSPTNTEYTYKLRVNNASAVITNLKIYTNLEEAQPNKTRWKGEFLGIDTSYAEKQGYTIKPYYSENPAAGNLYNKDGSINSDWKEYHENSREAGFYGGALAINFNAQCKGESSSYDYVEIYYSLDGKTYKLGKWSCSDLAKKTIIIPTDNFWLYWRTDSSVSSYYGFSIDSIRPANAEETVGTVATLPNYAVEEITGNIYPDSAFGSYTHGNYGNNVNKIWHYTYDGVLGEYLEEIIATDRSKVKSLAFEFLDNEGNTAVLPVNTLTYVLINMKSPKDEGLDTLARMDCRTQWNALDSYDRPVDFITGINSNVVKVALPNSVKADNIHSISLRFTKEIIGTDAAFENMQLNKAAQQTFMIRLTSLTANEDGTYNQVTALLKSDQELIISQIPAGTYLLEELGDNYFNFVNFTNNNDPEIIIEGVTFEQTDQGYIITVSEDLSETIKFNIKVTNEIEDERFYEYKDIKENLFLKNKIEEDSEDPS